MSDFVCECCGVYCVDLDIGYFSGCEYYLLDCEVSVEEVVIFLCNGFELVVWSSNFVVYWQLFRID